MNLLLRLTPETQELNNNFLHCNYERSETGIDQAVTDFQEILLRTAKRFLKRKVAKSRNHISNPTNKKWFGKDCRIKRHVVRTFKRRDPTNSDIRTSFHETLRKYKQLLKKKRENYKNDKLKELTTNQNDSQNFWSVFKSLSKTTITETTAPIKESEWLQHFGKLHSFPNQDHPQQQSIRVRRTEIFGKVQSRV